MKLTLIVLSLLCSVSSLIVLSLLCIVSCKEEPKEPDVGPSVNAIEASPEPEKK